LGFWLWNAGLPVQPPSKWEEVAAEFQQQPQGVAGVLSDIPPVAWSKDDEEDMFLWEHEHDFWEDEFWEFFNFNWGWDQFRDYGDCEDYLMDAYEAEEPVRAKRWQPAALFRSCQGDRQARCRAVEAKCGTKHDKEPRRSSVRSGAFSF